MKRYFVIQVDEEDPEDTCVVAIVWAHDGRHALQRYANKEDLSQNEILASNLYVQLAEGIEEIK